MGFGDFKGTCVVSFENCQSLAIQLQATNMGLNHFILLEFHDRFIRISPFVQQKLVRGCEVYSSYKVLGGLKGSSDGRSMV